MSKRKNRLQKKRLIKIIVLLMILISILCIIIIVVQNKVTRWNLTEKNRNSNENPNYIIDLANNIIIYESSLEINLNIQNFQENSNYSIIIRMNDDTVIEKERINSQEKFNIQLKTEGEKIINIDIRRDDEEDYNNYYTIYYLKPYKKQFLDELSNKGVTVHYRNGTWERYEDTFNLLLNSGIKYIRDDFIWRFIDLGSNSYNFNYYDDWIQEASENGIKILAVLSANGIIAGDDMKINTDEELSRFLAFVKMVNDRYPQIQDYEIFNEPNLATSLNGNEGYVSDNNLSWYYRVVQGINNILENENYDIISGATAVPTTATSNVMASDEFLRRINELGTYKYTNSYSIHPYDWDNIDEQNVKFNSKLTTHKDLLNSFGGFINLIVSEYGISSYTGINVTEDIQAEKLVQETVILDNYDVELCILYNFWNTGTDISQREQNFGLITNENTPKLSYYAMKNYYENTNGAEYIGIVNLADGLEAHVYDKDGKPKIIAWSDNADNTITIPYKNFTASDIYGNEIENTDGTLEITTSPVYLDNISDEYFYEAVSNTALEKYAEFEEKFETEIANINGLQEEINKLKEYMASIASNSTEDENVAIEQMNTHFNLGNVILSAYKNGSLDVEYVKLSSMLDMLNDIGSSYEDLLTVCATTRAPYYTATEELINSAESKINNNSDLEIVYPSKILDFAKELDEKSEYINSLSEENDIKTGLIVSNSLHAYYLSDWANEFASIYIDEYIEANPVTVSYSNTDEWTNQDVTATLNIGNDATVTNNGGSNTYTFKANGSFTFEYERRGQAFKLEAKVSNIDKTYPTIAGVKDGQTYTNSVKPVIEDTNLSIVSISYNGENMEYYDGITLEDEGMYSIVATDRAGNTTTVEFNIISNVQDEYVLQGNYLLNVWQETTLADFKNNYTSQEESYIIKRNDTELTDTDIIATGDIIELSSGDTYTIVVAGDINCDGRVTVFDLSALRRYILKQIEFTEIELLSADINIDGNNIGAKDYSRMRLEILGMH